GEHRRSPVFARSEQAHFRTCTCLGSAPGPLLGVQAARRKPNRSASLRPTARRLSQRPSQHSVVAMRRFTAFPNKGARTLRPVRVALIANRASGGGLDPAPLVAA